MRTLDKKLKDKKSKPTVMALGYFDSVHLGHKKVIETAKAYANDNDCALTVFTFEGNLKAMFLDKNEKMVFLPKEREQILKSVGADEIYFAPVKKSFLSLSKKRFLKKLNKKYNIKCYVSGGDYRFGKHGEGDVNFLSQFAKKKGQAQIVVEDFCIDDKKVSTTDVKELLTKGDVKKANQLLGREYSVTGTVFRDRSVGTDLGFPTLNMRIDNSKHALKEGVYAGKFEQDGIEYTAIINYGGRPTFDLNTRLIEAHVIGFKGDLYGKTVTLKFTNFMREIVKFEGVDELKKQLAIDMEKAKEEYND